MWKFDVIQVNQQFFKERSHEMGKDFLNKVLFLFKKVRKDSFESVTLN